MKYVKYIAGLTFFNLVISYTSLSLGLTTKFYDYTLDTTVDTSNVLTVVWQLIINNISSYIQLMTLQADIPVMLSVFIFIPLAMSTFTVIALIIRGIG